MSIFPALKPLGEGEAPAEPYGDSIGLAGASNFYVKVGMTGKNRNAT